MRRVTLLMVMAALLVLFSSASVVAKTPSFEIDVATTADSALFTLTFQGIDISAPAGARCCGPSLDDLIEVFPAEAVGTDFRPLPGGSGIPVNLVETSPGAYSGEVSLPKGDWIAVPFPNVDVGQIEYEFNDIYPAIAFSIDSSAGVLWLVGSALLGGLVVTVTLRSKPSRQVAVPQGTPTPIGQ